MNETFPHRTYPPKPPILHATLHTKTCTHYANRWLLCSVFCHRYLLICIPLYSDVKKSRAGQNATCIRARRDIKYPCHQWAQDSEGVNQNQYLYALKCAELGLTHVWIGCWIFEMLDSCWLLSFLARTSRYGPEAIACGRLPFEMDATTCLPAFVGYGGIQGTAHSWNLETRPTGCLHKAGWKAANIAIQPMPNDN